MIAVALKERIDRFTIGSAGSVSRILLLLRVAGFEFLPERFAHLFNRFTLYRHDSGEPSVSDVEGRQEGLASEVAPLPHLPWAVLRMGRYAPSTI